MPFKDNNKRNENTKRYKKENRDELLKRRRELYKIKNKDKIKDIISEEEKKKNKSGCDKRYRIKHANKVKKKKQDYYQDNKNEINKKYLDSLKNNPQKKIAHTIRTRIYQALKRKSKPSSSIKSLGCSLSEFMIHIENKFTDEMSWKNHGDYWHLDHIKPLCLFNLENECEYLLACQYSNYQPLKKLDNLKKNRYYGDQSSKY